MSKQDIRIGLAGVGYWGSKLARNIYDARGCTLAAISDAEAPRMEAAVERYAGSRGIDSLEQMISDPELDAVVLATPASMHAEHARAALEAGKHVLVEKPLALTSRDCDELCELAASQERVLMVGHTFIYSEPVRMLRWMIENGELGDLLYVYGQRLNLGVIREDLNALWNFGPHDISILLYLLDDVPTRVSARQFSLLNRKLEDVAFLVLEFSNGVVGHIHDSWLDPRKVREFTVVGQSKMAVYDDTDVESPLRVYDKGVVPMPFGEDETRRFSSLVQSESDGYGEFKLEVRAGDMLAPRVNGREPLRVEIEHFADCAASGTTPLTDGVHGGKVVRILEAADRSAREGGVAVDIELSRQVA
ncbi:MAG TPA: Gfo/Idh/MocA family oxidoreductase [Thermoleophilaceae bacterium]